MNQRGYINPDIFGAFVVAILLAGIVVGSVAMTIGFFLPGIWVWVKVTLHGLTAP